MEDKAKDLFGNAFRTGSLIAAAAAARTCSAGPAERGDRIAGWALAWIVYTIVFTGLIVLGGLLLARFRPHHSTGLEAEIIASAAPKDRESNFAVRIVIVAGIFFCIYLGTKAPETSPSGTGEPAPERQLTLRQGSRQRSLASRVLVPLRVWTNSQGKMTSASLMDARRDNAGIWIGTFQRENGETFTYQIKDLCPDDIRLICAALESLDGR
jgi:hypothetical protein